MLKERTVGASGMAKNVTIMRLEEKGYGGYYAQKELVWRDAGKADSFDSTQTYYYLPLSGFQFISDHGYGSSVKDLVSNLKNSGLEIVNTDRIYGVRKGDIEFIKTQKNWVNLEAHLVKTLPTIPQNVLDVLAANVLDLDLVAKYNQVKVDEASPFAKLMISFKDYKRVRFEQRDLASLFRHYAPKANFSLDAQVQAVGLKINEVRARYPLLDYIGGSADKTAVAEYIEMIDAKKGI
mgnify:FL=1